MALYLYELDIKFMLNTNCHFRSSAQSHIGFDSTDPIEVDARSGECNFLITNISRREHEGRWSCFLSKPHKSNGNSDHGWMEATHYKLKIFERTMLDISLIDSVMDEQLGMDGNIRKPSYTGMVMIIYYVTINIMY